MNTEYKSENPIIQKCLDVLDNPNVKVKEFTAHVLVVKVDGNLKFFITNNFIALPDDITFYVDKRENGMDFSDITMVWNKAQMIVKSREAEKVQKALKKLYSKPKAEQGKKKKNEKPQYAVPYEVSEVQEYLNAEKGLAGYNIGVRFKGLSNFPTPHFFDCENMHMYQDVNAGTSRVVYHFPFVGHGLINFGKLRAEHWYKKMKKQVDAYNAKQKTK